MSEDGIGAPLRRKEDRRFLTGTGTYTDDINRPGQAHAVIVRSPHAHAGIASIDTAAAAAAPGVIAVFTSADTTADDLGGLPCGWGITQADGSNTWNIKMSAGSTVDDVPEADLAHPI